jgi:hypothetical protein
MERKEIKAMLSDDLMDFLKKSGLFEKIQANELLCKACNRKLSIDNIAAICYDKEYLLYCNDDGCIEKITNQQ